MHNAQYNFFPPKKPLLLFILLLIIIIYDIKVIFPRLQKEENVLYASLGVDSVFRLRNKASLYLCCPGCVLLIFIQKRICLMSTSILDFHA